MTRAVATAPTPQPTAPTPAAPEPAGPAKVNPVTAEDDIRRTSATSVDEWVRPEDLVSREAFEAAFSNKYGDQSLDELDRDLLGEYYQGLDRVAEARASAGLEPVELPSRHVHSGEGLGVDAYLNPSGDLTAENMMTQRYVGDCYYVAGITAVAAGDPQALRDAIQPGVDEAGNRYYDVTLHDPEGTTVDFGDEGKFTYGSGGADGRIDSFYAGGATTVRVGADEIDAGHAAQARPADGDRTVSLFEVAMEKVIGHDDLNDGGSFNEAIYALTGRNGSSFEAGAGQAQTVIGDNPQLSQFADEQWRDAARGILDQGGFIGVSIAARSPGFEANWDPDAPSSGHQYAVLEVTDAGLVMANPWGFVEPGADFDPQAFDPAKNGDGVFFVPWDEAQSTFHSVSVVGGPSASTPAATVPGDLARDVVLDRAVQQYHESGRPGGASDADVRAHWSGQLSPELISNLYFLLRSNPSADVFAY